MRPNEWRTTWIVVAGLTVAVILMLALFTPGCAPGEEGQARPIMDFVNGVLGRQPAPSPSHQAGETAGAGLELIFGTAAALGIPGAGAFGWWRKRLADQQTEQERKEKERNRRAITELVDEIEDMKVVSPDTVRGVLAHQTKATSDVVSEVKEFLRGGAPEDTV
jgi:hypothetical protein